MPHFSQLAALHGQNKQTEMVLLDNQGSIISNVISTLVMVANADKASVVFGDSCSLSIFVRRRKRGPSSVDSP